MHCVLEAWGQHEHELRGFLIRQLRGDREQAEDVLQETFLRAIKSASKESGAAFCSLDNPRAWLFQVTRNQLIDQSRRKALRPVLDSFEEEGGDTAQGLVAPEVHEAVEAIDSLDVCLPLALKELSEEDRLVLVDCDLNGMRQAEFARIHGLGLPAVKSRVQRARRRLKTALARRCEVRFDEQGKVCCFNGCEDDQSGAADK